MIYQNILYPSSSCSGWPGKTVVTVLPDTAERYFSTPLFEE